MRMKVIPEIRINKLSNGVIISISMGNYVLFKSNWCDFDKMFKLFLSNGGSNISINNTSMNYDSDTNTIKLDNYHIFKADDVVKLREKGTEIWG